ncbi:ankyrin repeat-containing domain protein [Penicillium frequentans]|uniref:Ankyrin repeat-containing domain protein n=1 Tax=Penicillium frequentans TaxID=3151616 RepID=A0AAD6CK32_9EURO|nr:ankyrin repeat-containing domain protein [Penicillium glabrum]
MTALDIAVLIGSQGLVTLFLENGADPNAGCAVVIAVYLGLTEIVSLLLKNREGAESSNADFTAFHAASVKNHVKIVEIFIEGGAHIRQTDALGQTSLFAAAWHRATGVVQRLLRHIHHQDGDFVHHCIDYFKAAYLCYEALDNGKGFERDAAFNSDAALDGDVNWDIAKLLLDPLSCVSLPSVTVFFHVFCVACAVGSISHVKKLLVKVPDPETLRRLFESDPSHPRSQDHASIEWALTLAACHGPPEVVQVIFEKSRQLKQDLTRCNALQYTCSSDLTHPIAQEVVRILILSDIDINYRGNSGVSAIAHALRQSNWFVVNELIYANADVDAGDIKDIKNGQELLKKIKTLRTRKRRTGSTAHKKWVADSVAGKIATLNWSRFCRQKVSVHESTSKVKKAIYFENVRRFSRTDLCNENVMYYWANLMERARQSGRYSQDKNTPLSKSFIEAAYGTLMLAVVAMSDYDQIPSDQVWSLELGIENPDVDRLKKRALEALEYDLGLSRWSLAMEKLQCLRKASLEVKMERQAGDDRSFSKAMRDYRCIKHSLRQDWNGLPVSAKDSVTLAFISHILLL